MKEQIINDILAETIKFLDVEHQNFLKTILIVKLTDFEITPMKKEITTEIKTNEWIIKRFSLDMLAKGIKISTIKCYIYTVNSFLKYTKLNYKEVISQNIIDFLAIKQYIKIKNNNHLSQNYIATICRNLLIFFQWAFKKHHISENIVLDIDRVHQKSCKKDRLTKEEIELCRTNINNNREKALYELMLSTGMRVGEITKLKITDINFSTREIKIHGYKSDSSEREGILSYRACIELKKYINDRQNGYVFISQKNNINSKEMVQGTIETIAKNIGKKSNVHVKTTVHIFRKTFASELYNKTKDIKLVSIMLGHADTRVTERCYICNDNLNIKQIMLNII